MGKVRNAERRVYGYKLGYTFPTVRYFRRESPR